MPQQQPQQEQVWTENLEGFKINLIREVLSRVEVAAAYTRGTTVGAREFIRDNEALLAQYPQLKAILQRFIDSGQADALAPLEGFEIEIKSVIAQMPRYPGR